LIGVLVFSIMAVSILAAFMTYFALMEQAKNTNIAINDAQNVIEQIRNIEPFSDTNLNSFVSSFNSSVFSNLTNEQVTITHNVSSDPFTVSVTVNWQDLGGRQRNISLSTLMTQR
jgi:hypothetical protein